MGKGRERRRRREKKAAKRRADVVAGLVRTMAEGYVPWRSPTIAITKAWASKGEEK